KTADEGAIKDNLAESKRQESERALQSSKSKRQYRGFQKENGLGQRIEIAINMVALDIPLPNERGSKEKWDRIAKRLETRSEERGDADFIGITGRALKTMVDNQLESFVARESSERAFSRIDEDFSHTDYLLGTILREQDDARFGKVHSCEGTSDIYKAGTPNRSSKRQKTSKAEGDYLDQGSEEHLLTDEEIYESESDGSTSDVIPFMHNPGITRSVNTSMKVRRSEKHERKYERHYQELQNQIKELRLQYVRIDSSIRGIEQMIGILAQSSNQQLPRRKAF
ncbi:hypothetical protein BGZ49_004921, partial [Haplosporangium sp. Z 27]